MKLTTESPELVVNARYTFRRLTGVERYASEIVRRLHPDIRIVDPGRDVPGGLGHLWEQLVLPLLIRPGELLWSPANTGPLLVTDQMLTIHDLSWLEHPESYRSMFVNWYRILLPQLIQRVRSVITASHYVKLRITSHFQISENRIIVIPGGVDHNIFYPVDEARQRLGHFSLPERFILYVGTHARHKNLLMLCEAWRLFQERCSRYDRDIHLVLAGSGGGVFRKLVRPDIHGVVSLGYVPDVYLPAIYSSALAYINPSLSEGFGLTLLEAMACGTAVLSSTRGALPEVAGNAALYFDPLEMEDIAGCLSRIVSDIDLRHDLQRRSLTRAAQYSWEASAKQVLQAIPMLAGV